MFDDTPEDRPLTEWQSTLAAGNLVMFRYPVADEREGPEPKARPCLVIERCQLGDTDCAVLAYGTTADTAANRGLDVHVIRPDEITAAGLHRPTRFVCARRVTVALSHHDWVSHPGLGTPVIGRLTGDSMIAMRRMRGRIRADQIRIKQAVRPRYAAELAPPPIVETRSRKRVPSVF